MREGPDITRIAALVGDPARANMLDAMMSGLALTAGELAGEAGVTPQTASGHLAQLLDAGLVAVSTQGRHRYFRIADASVAQALEALSFLAFGHGGVRTRPGPRDPALRAARVCYDHLAGALGVALFARAVEAGHLGVGKGGVSLTGPGRAFFEDFGIDVSELAAERRPLCRACLDWSERTDHLAGSLGAAVLARVEAGGWVRRVPGSRAVEVTASGRDSFARSFGLTAWHTS